MKLLHLLALIGATAVLSQGYEAEIDILQEDPNILEEEPNILQQRTDALQENHEFIMAEPKVVQHSPEIEDSVEQVANGAGRNLVGFRGGNSGYRKLSSERPGVFKLHFLGPNSKKVKDIFINVTNIVNSVINSRPSFRLRKKIKLRDACDLKNLTGKAVLKPMTLDSIPLFITQGPSDGEGGVMASTAACLSYKFSSNFRRVAVAAIDYDPADINDEANYTKVHSALLHEAFHALGFGLTLQRYFYNSDSFPFYFGPKAVDEYHSLLSEHDVARYIKSVPLENSPYSGVHGSHWRTKIFGDELMVAFLNGGKYILSNLTMKVFEDLGFSINYDSPFIEPYTLPTAEEMKNIANGRDRDA